MDDKFKNLKREHYPIPDFVKKALNVNNLMEKYKARPAYRQNDYIGWINRAIREEIKMIRLNQMLTELRNGGLYMNMKYNG